MAIVASATASRSAWRSRRTGLDASECLHAPPRLRAITRGSLALTSHRGVEPLRLGAPEAIPRRCPATSAAHCRERAQGVSRVARRRLSAGLASTPPSPTRSGGRGGPARGRTPTQSCGLRGPPPALSADWHGWPIHQGGRPKYQKYTTLHLPIIPRLPVIPKIPFTINSLFTGNYTETMTINLNILSTDPPAHLTTFHRYWYWLARTVTLTIVVSSFVP